MSTAAMPESDRSMLGQRWSALAVRERVMVAAMASALAFLVVWLVAVRPAWRTISTAPALKAQADTQLFAMQAMADEARQLRALPPVPQGQAEQVLKSATERLGVKGKLAVASERATLSVTGATGEDIRQWLTEARNGARARPIEATLTRSGEGYNGTLIVAIGQGQ